MEFRCQQGISAKNRYESRVRDGQTLQTTMVQGVAFSSKAESSMKAIGDECARCHFRGGRVFLTDRDMTYQQATTPRATAGRERRSPAGTANGHRGWRASGPPSHYVTLSKSTVPPGRNGVRHALAADQRLAELEPDHVRMTRRDVAHRLQRSKTVLRCYKRGPRVVLESYIKKSPCGVTADPDPPTVCGSRSRSSLSGLVPCNTFNFMIVAS